MISNQILQNTIEGLKAITRIDLCVMDIEGKVLASTFSNAEDYEKFVLEFVNSPADSQVLQGFQFFKVFDEHQLEFIILARGDSDDVYMIGKVASFQICWWPTRNVLTRTTLSRICCLIICFLLIFIIVPRNCILIRMYEELYCLLK